jgi:nitrate/nitrite transporter NarK
LSCSFSPAAVTPGSGSANSTLTVSALVATGANQPHRRSLPVYATFLFIFGLPGLVLAGNIRRRAMIQKAAVGAVIGIILICASCGGNPAPAQVGSAAAAPGAYSVTINGISGSTQLATPVTVTVQ